jgi:hypothetical protein
MGLAFGRHWDRLPSPTPFALTVDASGPTEVQTITDKSPQDAKTSFVILSQSSYRSTLFCLDTDNMADHPG